MGGRIFLPPLLSYNAELDDVGAVSRRVVPQQEAGENKIRRKKVRIIINNIILHIVTNSVKLATQVRGYTVMQFHAPSPTSQFRYSETIRKSVHINWMLSGLLPDAKLTFHL